MRTQSIVVALVATLMAGCATAPATQEPAPADCSFGCQLVVGLAETAVSAAFDTMFSRNERHEQPRSSWTSQHEHKDRQKHRKGGAQ